MIKIIMFDLGGVVFEENWEKLNEEFVKKFGISVLIRNSYGLETQEVYDGAIIGKKSMCDVFSEICKINGLKRNIDELCDFYKECYKRNQKINEKVVELIKQLKKRFKIVCLTDTNNLHFKSHEEQGILDLFDEKFGSHELGMRKKDKQTFKIVLDKLRVKPNEVLFVDDKIVNIESARSARINVIHFVENSQFEKEIRCLLEN